MSEGLPLAAVAPAERTRARLHDYVALTKPGIMGMALVTTLAGYLVASGGSLDVALLLATLGGTALVGAGSSALNMFLEREADGRMVRTRNRPLPSGRMQPGEALAFGVASSSLGVLLLSFGANGLAGLLGAAAVVAYVFLYTPLKKRTSLCTVVGAVPGALPPLIGWAAARGALGIEAWVLFFILFFWQLPHFLAIGWMWREDYARAGYPMLPVLDPDGAITARQVVLQSLALLLVSLAPAVTGLAWRAYFFGAVALGLGLLFFGVRFARERSRARASGLFLASIAYLPVLLALVVLGGRLPRVG